MDQELGPAVAAELVSTVWLPQRSKEGSTLKQDSDVMWDDDSTISSAMQNSRVCG